MLNFPRLVNFLMVSAKISEFFDFFAKTARKFTFGRNFNKNGNFWYKIALVVENMIKNFIVNGSIDMIKGLEKYTEIELEEIKYGIESLYLAISKVVVILAISAILGLFKPALAFLILFNILRIPAFGLHASKSIWCWITSSISFIGIPFICINFKFPNLVIYIFTTLCLISFILFAPADTIKRPLINAKKRKRYKILSVLFSIIYIILIYTTKSVLLKNLLLFALIFETILILPITYKLFKLPYNNYKNYK